jgi:hypothetical protein
MKKYLFTLVFALAMSVTAIGATEPDRPIRYLLMEQVENTTKTVVVIGQADLSRKIASIFAVHPDAFIAVCQSAEIVDTTSYKVQSYDSYDLDASMILTANVTTHYTEELEITNKVRDRYRMPKYEYKPSIKPPRITAHRA